jgi:hypothetical protein
VAGLLLLTAVAVRLPALPERSWWIDELITRDVARLPLITAEAFSQSKPPFNSIISFCLHDTGPGPLTYLLDGMFAAQATPMGAEFWMRVPPVISGLLTVALIICAGRHLTGTHVGALAMSVGAAVMPAMVDYTTTPRGYGWAVLFGLLHLTALVKGRYASKRGRPAIAQSWWLAAVVSACAAILIHAVSLVWVTACLAAALTTPTRGAARWARRALLSAAVVIVTVAIGWCSVWLSRLAYTPNAMPVARSWQEIVAGLVTATGTLVADGSAILLALTLAMIAIVSRQRLPGPSLCSRAVAFALLLSAVLAAGLAYKFFLAPRHLFPAQIALLLLAGLLSGTTLGFLARLTGTVRPRRMATVLLLVLGVMALPFAVKQAQTPMQDWRNAMRRLAAAYQPGDMILCGPNSDLEVVRAYAVALGIPPDSVPRWIDAGHGHLLSSGSEAGVMAAIASPNRLWFVTGFYGQVRPASYWTLIKQHFRPVATVATGRLPVMILLHDKPDKSF